MNAFATDATAAFAVATAAAGPVTLSDIVASLFAVNLREKLAAETSADNADAAFVWGM